MFPADESVRVEEHPGGEHVGAAAVGVVAHDGVAQPVAVHPAMWHAVRAWNEGYPKVHEDFTITEKTPTCVLNVKALMGTRRGP